jgi:hypothetical protein
VRIADEFFPQEISCPPLLTCACTRAMCSSVLVRPTYQIRTSISRLHGLFQKRRDRRCVGSLCSPAVLVAGDITLPLRRKYLLGCVTILHEGILAIMPKWSTDLVFASSSRRDEVRKVDPYGLRPFQTAVRTVHSAACNCHREQARG